MDGDGEDDVSYRVYHPSVVEVFNGFVGWMLGWVCYGLARTGFERAADTCVDRAIRLRRGNPGAIRTVGYLNARGGRLAMYRGRLLVHGQTGRHGAFANKGFYATYDIAARTPERALELIARWEWDAIVGSLEILEGELDFPDSGGEGILWVSNGRTFYDLDD